MLGHVSENGDLHYHTSRYYIDNAYYKLSLPDRMNKVSLRLDYGSTDVRLEYMPRLVVCWISVGRTGWGVQNFGTFEYPHLNDSMRTGFLGTTPIHRQFFTEFQSQCWFQFGVRFKTIHTRPPFNGSTVKDRMTLESDMDTEKELLRLLPVQTQAYLPRLWMQRTLSSFLVILLCNIKVEHYGTSKRANMIWYLYNEWVSCI